MGWRYHGGMARASISVLVVLTLAGCGRSPRATGDPDARAVGDGDDGGDGDAAGAPDGGLSATLDGNRDRLLQTYYAWLESQPDVQQSNGLRGRDLDGVCELWSALDPSSQAVFLTITHRLQGSTLADGSHALDHVTTLYRAIGGRGATETTPGSCGGDEYNRMILAMDGALHDALLAANTRRGAAPYDLADIPATSFWRDAHDVSGPHAPFDLSDETDAGAPRGQAQYFRDPASAAAHQPLGRMDLMTLVQPYALEIDQDYDCTHNSNPSCDYVFYGPACAPKGSAAGTAIYAQNYGDFEPGWTPAGC